MSDILNISKIKAKMQVITTLLANRDDTLANKLYVNEVTLKGQKPPLKCCQPIELLIYLEIRSISFIASNMVSVGQRAVKLPSVKL